MKKQFLTFTFALVAALSFAPSSEAAPVKLRKISRLTAPQEATTFHMIQSLKAKVESECRALSNNGKPDRLEFISEKIVSSHTVGKTTFRDLNLVVVRKFEGQRYYVRASAHWDLDQAAPQIGVQLESKYCR